jgi:hypothetical protein
MINATPDRHTSTSMPPKPGDFDVVAEGKAVGVEVGVSLRLIKSVVFAMSVGTGVTVTVT